MRIAKYLLFLVALLASTLSLSAQQVTVQNKLDSAAIFIGNRIGITLEVTADKGKNVELPQYDSLQVITPGVEFVSATKPDTQYVNDGKRMVLTRKYYITSFDSALYFIPAMQVKVDKKPYKGVNMALKVVTFNVDTLHPEKIFPSKSVMSPPFDFGEWKLLLWLSLIVVIVTAILLYVGVRLKDNKPIIRHIRLKQRLAPHKEAMMKIEKIKEDKIWQSEDSKEYYTALTDTLRQYIKERYGFNATEMTSYEIIQHLEDVNDGEAINELRELFQTADLVKFAKYSTLINENDRNLVYAIEYINQTKVEDTKPQPEEIVVEEKRSKKTKLVLVGLVVGTSFLLLALVSYLLYRIFFIVM